MIALIPCAGKGTRLGVTGPKELIGVGGRPVIDYSLDVLRKRGVDKVSLVVAPGKESVAKYVALAAPDVALTTIYQREPLGTGHAVGLVSSMYGGEDFLYLMPDTVQQGMPLSLPTNPLDLTVFLWQTDTPEAMGNFVWDKRGVVNGHVEKKKPDWDPPYWAWGAAVLPWNFLHLASQWSMQKPAGKEFTIDDAFDLWLKSGRSIYAWRCDGWYQDCGTAEGIRRAEELLRKS